MTFPATRSGRAPSRAPHAGRFRPVCNAQEEADDFAAYATRRDPRAHERLVRTYLPLTGASSKTRNGSPFLNSRRGRLVKQLTLLLGKTQQSC